MSSERAITVEEFERIAPLLDSPSELVDGKLRVMSPTNFRHGLISAHLAFILKLYMREHPNVGVVVGEETGFRINDPRHPVQAPDAAFVSAARVPRATHDVDDPLDHFMDGAPDLAIEILSPSDVFTETQEKALRWLTAGAREVWLVDGRHEVVYVLRPREEMRALRRDDVLSSPHLLPGFSLPLPELFATR